MKTKTNIALEGTCDGDVVGGLYREPRENLQALFLGRGNINRIILRSHKIGNPWKWKLVAVPRGFTDRGGNTEDIIGMFIS